MYNKLNSIRRTTEKPELYAIYAISPKSVYPRDGSLGVKTFQDFVVKDNGQLKEIKKAYRYVQVVKINGTRKGLIVITDKAQKAVVSKLFKNLELDENSLAIYKAARSKPVKLPIEYPQPSQ